MIIKLYRDIRNKIIISRAIKKWNNTQDWNKFNMIKGWFNNFGFIVNLNKEYFGESEDLKNIRILEYSKPVYEFVANQMKIGDLVSPKIKYIDNTYSYLIKFKQIYNNYNLFEIIIFFVILISILNYNYIFLKINEVIKWILN